MKKLFILLFLSALLSSDSCAVAFIGDKYTTDKLIIKPKIRAVMLETLELFYNSLN